jgi:hypothetical protein
LDFLARRRLYSGCGKARQGYRMADVDMPDATGPAKVKNTKGGGTGDADGKKRFEVKKVRDKVYLPFRRETS